MQPGQQLQPPNVQRGANIQQLEISLKISEGELRLWEQKLASMQDKGRRERCVIDAVCKHVGFDAQELAALKRYLESHKQLDEADMQITELQVAKLKGQCEIIKAALAELADKSPIVPPAGTGPKIHIPGGR